MVVFDERDGKNDKGKRNEKVKKIELNAKVEK